MLKRTYEDQVCSVARALEVVGERWTVLILRDAFLGVRRFDDFQRSLGIARNVLTDRLGRLTEEDILKRRAYQQNPERYEYRLTEKGIELWPSIVMLMKWGDRYMPPAKGPPVIVEHRECGGTIGDDLRCVKCDELLTARDTQVRLGPGAPKRRKPVQPALAG